jgi:hypothetical protein
VRGEPRLEVPRDAGVVFDDKDVHSTPKYNRDVRGFTAGDVPGKDAA